jgi:DNA polymerase I-like protein with 3'-5' exonuclease and polymerase domains
MIVAIDFETFYDKNHSIKGSHVDNYVHEPEFDAFLVSLAAEDGMTWVGHPKAYPDWLKHEGDLFVAHNASFDSVVFKRCQELGDIPQFETQWECTSDLCRYIQAPRSLKGAAYALFGIEKDKTVRDTKMRGKHWADIVREGLDKEVMEYALDDSVLCLRIWQEHSDKWPDSERRLSHMSREMGLRGIYVDQQKVSDGITALQSTVFSSEQNLPWTNEYDAKTKNNFPPLSLRGLNLACQNEGIDPPARTAKDSVEREEWEARYGKKFPWVNAMTQFRQANKHLKTVETIQRRIRKDGTMPYGLKYGGADVTMRFSGDTGFNTQNMPRASIMGVDIRSFFVPRPGHKFIISDLSQIEPRCLALMSGDRVMLEAMASGQSPYEAHARASMGYAGEQTLKEADPNMYTLAKARVLSLGYGASWKSFILSAKAYGVSELLRKPIEDETMYKKMYDYLVRYARSREILEWFVNATELERTEACNAWMQVSAYRRDNKLVTKFWKMLDKNLHDATSERNADSTLELDLPSGRTMRYYDLHLDNGQVRGATQLPDSSKFGGYRYLYGGKLCENLCQSLAREVFGYYLLKIVDKGYAVVLQIHDEVVVEVPEAQAERACAEIKNIMSSEVEWLPHLPTAAEAKITERYEK